MNASHKFMAKLVLSLALAALAAVMIGYDFISFALVFLIAAWAFCPVRSLHPTRSNIR